MGMRTKVTRIVNNLFYYFMAHKNILPEKWQNDLSSCNNEQETARVVVNYISGMTDRFAIWEHNRLMGDQRL